MTFPRFIGVFVVAALFPFLLRSGASSSSKCVRIYYDKGPTEGAKYYLGRIHAQMLQNVLGHFPHIQQYVSPIDSYQAGDLEKCEASFYLGTFYNAKIPKSFLEDYVKTKKNVVWAGYQIWQLSKEELKSLWGVEFTGLSQLDSEHLDKKGRPGFFRFYDYLDETFVKYGEFDKAIPPKFQASFEISMFKLTGEDSKKHVKSWARHSTQTELTTPYILQNQNHWYFGDSPFYFATEDDRYLILSDLLFDVLNEKPVRAENKHPAVFRLEDIHPKLFLWQLYKMTDLLAEHHVPFSMTVIPIFSDPLGNEQEKKADRFVPLTQRKEFVEFLKYAKNKGASFIFHGLTHQYGKKRNPFTAMSGDDFEFWDRVNNQPIDKDSVDFVLGRLEEGRRLLAEAGIDPVSWISPHYQASPLDYILFGQLFKWNMGRIIYFPYEVSGGKPLSENFRIDAVPFISHTQERKQSFSDIKVSFPEKLLPAGQFYPFEIYGDTFGQRIIPENVGNVQPFLNEQVMRTLSVDQMVATMKRNRKLRDTWASYFIHPFLLEESSHEGLAKFEGDVEEIVKLIKQTREAGYEFIDLKEWVGNSSSLRTLRAIEE